MYIKDNDYNWKLLKIRKHFTNDIVSSGNIEILHLNHPKKKHKGNSVVQ